MQEKPNKLDKPNMQKKLNKQENLIVRTTEFAMMILQQYISEGDTVLDATMGNGLDTLTLAGLVGIHKGMGQVHGFDIQQDAMEATAALLEKNGYDCYIVKDQHRSIENIVPHTDGKIYLYLDSHANIDQYINSRLSAAIFNLGYLPGGDKCITTQSASTLAAVRKASLMLKQDGIIVLVLYPGHQKGREEKTDLLEFMHQLPSSAYHAEMIETVNQNAACPCIALITRKKD